MPIFSRASMRGASLPTLLATTSLAALLLGGASARAGGLSFDGQTQASVTNPANTTVTSIVINNSTVTGAVTNAGTISPGKAGAGFNRATVALAVTNNSTIGGGIHNSGTISATGSGINVFGILISDANGTVNTIAGGSAIRERSARAVPSTMKGYLSGTPLLSLVTSPTPGSSAGASQLVAIVSIT